MGQFGSETRRWLESAIKQRKLLMRLNKSHKPQAEVIKAIDALETQLKAYTYEVDLYMARFIRQHRENIEAILPGAGSACARKRNLEWNGISYQATQIIAGAIKFKQLETV